jgi:membrane protease YdiL (CAAX protease family)
MQSLKNDRFDAFVTPAKARKSGWFLVLGLVLIVIFYLEFMYLIIFLLSCFIGVGETLTTKFGWIMRLLASRDTPLAMVATLSTFVGMIGSVLLTAWILRERSPLSLLGKGPVLRNMLISGSILALLLTFSTLVAHLFFDMQPNLPLTIWFKWLPIALPLLFIQITAEELIFRGYLQQELAARYSSPKIWMLVPSLVFGALHWDTEQFGPNAWLLVVGTTLFGLFAADITARTGNLGAAIGLHFANNFFALFITTIDGSMTGLGLYLTPFTPENHDLMRMLLLWDIGLVAIAYGVYLAVIRLKRRRRLHSGRADLM